MKKQLLIIAILCLLLSTSKGQSNYETIISWLPAVSLGETAGFTNGFSPRGMDIESSKYINKDLTIGFALGWNVFREKAGDDLLNYDGFVISGTQFRYFNTVPINLKMKKYFGFNKINTFLGLGVGTSYSKARTDIGLFQITEDKWQFNISPEIGSVINVSDSFFFALKVKYNYSPRAGDFDPVSYLGIGFGVAFR